jgi:hypothetical protein
MPDSAVGLMWETDTDISASFRWTPLRRAAAPTAALDLHGVPVPGISTLIALISTLIALGPSLVRRAGRFIPRRDYRGVSTLRCPLVALP